MGSLQPCAHLDSLTGEVLALGRELGLAAIGVASGDVLEPARSVLLRRKRRGLASDMQFTYRNPDRSTDPARSMPTKSIVAGALRYHAVPAAESSEPSQPVSLAGAGAGAACPAVGRVARYAQADHYGVLRSHLETVAGRLRAEGYRAEVHADDNHLVDRNVAYAAGLGWYGKSANLLVPGHGSWVVLGSILTDAPLVPNGQAVSDGCGPCRRCIDACPTGAIVAPGVVDARRCLAWLVQRSEPIPVEFRESLGDRIYGCDDCQEVCPPNQEIDVEAVVGETPGERTPGPDALAHVSLSFVLEADDDTLMERLGRWYIAGRDPNVLRRTALIALGNTAAPTDVSARSLLRRYAAHPQPDLAEHAQWSLARLDQRATAARG